MLHLRICLFAFLVLVVGFAVSTDDICDKEVESGTEGCTLSFFENNMKKVMDTKNKIGSWWDNLWKKKATTYGAVLTQNNFGTIAPGTYWCGDGNKAKSDEDLGRYSEVDKCCREHDMCSYSIAAGSTLLNLINDATFTRSHCVCDNKFYDCLKTVKGAMSTMYAKGIGNTYFNILRPQCFQCKCPVESCDDNSKNCNDSCKRHEWVPCRKW